MNEARLKTKVSRPETVSLASSMTQKSVGGLNMGQRVMHHVFGDGIIVQCEGYGEHARIQVRFESAGTKWLIASFVTAKA